MYIKNDSIAIIPINENELMIREGVFSQRSILLEDEEKSSVLQSIVKFLDVNPSFDEKTLKKYFSDQIENPDEIIEFLLKNNLVHKIEKIEKKNIVIISNVDIKMLKSIVSKINSTDNFYFIGKKEYQKNPIFDNKIDFVVMFFDRYSPSEFHKFNFWANKEGHVNQISFLDNRCGYILPINKPKYTACYNEAEIHLEASVKNLKETLAHKAEIQLNGNSIVPNEADLIIQYAILLNYIATFNQVGFEKNILTYINFSNMEIEKTKIFKMPYCSACNLDEEYTHIFL